MDGMEFLGLVRAHKDLELLGAAEGETPEGDEVFVRHLPSGLTLALPVTSVIEHPWEELEAVMTGRRPGRVLTHITRIVGYFSHVHNWNRSKVAELRDRRRGSYTLPERSK